MAVAVAEAGNATTREPARRVVRLPLQVGTAALWSQVRWSIFGFPVVAWLVGGMIAIPMGFNALYERGLPKWIAGTLGMIGLVVHVMLFIFELAWVLGERSNARERRPSDIILDDEGIRIEGGEHDGRAVQREASTTEALKLVEKEDDESAVGAMAAFLVRRLRGLVGLPPSAPRKLVRWELRHGKSLVAATDQADEKESLEAAIDAMNAHASAADAAGADDLGSKADVRKCKGCGATLRLLDAEDVVCAHCGKVNRVPKKLRDRVRAAAEVHRSRTRVEKRLASVLAQPGAAWANTLLWIARWPMALSWWVGLAIVIATCWQSWSLPGLRAATEAGLVLAIVPALPVRLLLAHRRALRSVVMRFGARPPQREGEPFECRHCGAPLPEYPGSVLSQCAYCATDNVLGIDLRRDVHPAREAAGSVEKILSLRARERARWLGLTLAGAAAAWWVLQDVRAILAAQ